MEIALFWIAFTSTSLTVAVISILVQLADIGKRLTALESKERTPEGQ